MCEDIRHTIGMKELYSKRKETIERLFGTTKENHGFRYTQMFGKARMEMKVGLTYAYMNLKKLARMKQKRSLLERAVLCLLTRIPEIHVGQRKTVLRFAS